MANSCAEPLEITPESSRPAAPEPLQCHPLQRIASHERNTDNAPARELEATIADNVTEILET
jgi:hypothetical protein